MLDGEAVEGDALLVGRIDSMVTQTLGEVAIELVDFGFGRLVESAVESWRLVDPHTPSPVREAERRREPSEFVGKRGVARSTTILYNE